MRHHERPPAGPRGRVGAAAEDAAVEYLRSLGWSVIARNIRLGEVEIDILAVEPGVPDEPVTTVIVEVRSRSGPAFGAAIESVDARKVVRLYRALGWLRRGGQPGVDIEPAGKPAWRIDLLALSRDRHRAWVVEHHLRGLAPP